MMLRVRRLTIFMLAVATVLFAMLEVRLFQLQVIGTRAAEESLPYRLHQVTEQRERGRILDRRGGVVAATRTGFDVYAWSPDVSKANQVRLAQELEQRTGVDAASVLRKLDARRWPRLAEGILDPSVARELELLGERAPFRAMQLSPRYVRVYPRGDLYAPLVGYVNHEHRGVFGLEEYLDRLLRPSEGHYVVRRDNRQQARVEPDFESEPAQPGSTVHLTLDPLVQRAAESALDRQRDAFGGNWSQALVLDPQSGELLAVAQRPSGHAGRPESSAALQELGSRCLATQELYAPGSTFKAIMMALVLEHLNLDLQGRIDCGNRAWSFGRRVLHDTHSNGRLTPAEILIESSNIGMARLVLRLSPEEARRGDPSFQFFLDYIHQMGLGAKALGFGGEQEGLVPSLSGFSRNYTLVSLAMGHEIAVTTLQMAAAAATLVNGGIWRQPHLVLGWERSGQWCDFPVRERRVLRPRSSQIVRDMLRRVVEEGSIQKHRPRGYSVGGKTGTPEKEKDRSVISPSFFCFAPVEDPQVLVLMVSDGPRDSATARYAAQLVAPFALELLRDVLRLRKVAPDRPEELEMEHSTPSVAWLGR